MLLRSYNTLGGIQSGFMKLLPIQTLRREKTALKNEGSVDNAQFMKGNTYPQERSRSLELGGVPSDKTKSRKKSRSRNNSVKVVNRSQAKSMSSLQALRGAGVSRIGGGLSPSSSNGTRHNAVHSDDSSPSSVYLEHENLPYTLTVELVKEKLYTHTSINHSLLGTRKVKFN